MWKMVDLSIVASSGQGRVFGGRPRDEEMRVQLQSYVRLPPHSSQGCSQKVRNTPFSHSLLSLISDCLRSRCA